ncbi:MAG: right-handed parallel beta-helix repeat-containing protein [Planctomycetes bacterium]|nr:right-handed parallel beta-helix repeat-containing protein [Planctomycetota bacterium]
MKTCWAMLFAVLGLLVAPAEGGKIKVPGDHATIQAALTAGTAGDVVEVSSGTYFENVTISGTDITLRAKSGHTVTIDAGGSGVPLSIGLATGVTVQNIRLQNTADSAGLEIGFASTVLIKGCTVEGASLAGITVVLGYQVVIEECAVKNCGGDGIRLLTFSSVVRDTIVKKAGDDGIVVLGSANTIEGNSVLDPGDDGIQLGENPDGCASCLVMDNKIEDADDGIYLDGTATENSILDNKVANAVTDGIELQDGAVGNIVSGNVIQASGGSGIEGDSENCIYSKNKVQNSASSGIWNQANAQYCMFYKNKVKQSLGDGFEVEGDFNGFVENQAKNSGSFDLNDNTAPGSNYYVSNTFTTIAP